MRMDKETMRQRIEEDGLTIAMLESDLLAKDKAIESLRAELAEQQEISHNFHRMSNEYLRERDEARQECAQWKAEAETFNDQVEKLEGLLKSIKSDAEERAQKAEQANAALLEGLRELPNKIMQVDSFADCDTVSPFPMESPTEEDQIEWFELYCEAQREHIDGLIEDLLAQYDTAQPTAKGEDKPYERD